MTRELLRDLRNRKVILFAGAGVSMNVGLPSWSTLIDEIGKQLGFDPAVFRQMGDSLSLAEYYLLEQNSIGKLRSWLDVEWHSVQQRQKVNESRLYEAIATLPWAAIYTTNFDCYLEWIYEHLNKPYHKIVTVKDMATVPHDDHVQIVKLHGDFTDDQSIVLSETSYFERLELNAPIDLKLRADILGKSVLFVGYSLSDINIRLLFFRLSQLWRGSRASNFRPRCYAVMRNPQPIRARILESWGITPIELDATESLEDFFTNLVQQVS